MTEYDIKQIRKNANYKSYRFRSGRELIFLFDQFTATRLRTAPNTEPDIPYDTKDIFGNNVLVIKEVNARYTGTDYFIVNTNYNPIDAEFERLNFDITPRCHCGLLLDEIAFDASVQLITGVLTGQCECRRRWEIQYSVKDNLCPLKLLYGLWKGGGDNTNNIQKVVTIGSKPA